MPVTGWTKPIFNEYGGITPSQPIYTPPPAAEPQHLDAYEVAKRLKYRDITVINEAQSIGFPAALEKKDLRRGWTRTSGDVVGIYDWDKICEWRERVRILAGL